MKRILLIVSLFLAMNAFAQEQLLRLPQEGYDPPKEIRFAPLYGKKVVVKRIANAHIRFCQIAALSSELKVANLTNNDAKKTWF